MPSTNKTENLSLNQYESYDHFTREDYNGDMQHIDAACPPLGLIPLYDYGGSAIYIAGGVMNLSQSMDDFQKLVFLINLNGIETRHVYPSIWPSGLTHVFRSNNLADTLGIGVDNYEFGIKRNSATQLEIVRNFRQTWTGASASSATSSADSSSVYIRQILGSYYS